MKFILIFMAILPTPLAKKTYQFIFPDSSNNPQVKFHGTIDHPLVEFTLCHWMRVTAIHTNWGAIFSYSTPTTPEQEIATLLSNTEILLVNVRGIVVSFDDIKKSSLPWVHICLTSSVLRGPWVIYIDGIQTWNGTSTHANPIPPNGTVLLGHEKLASGEFNPHASFKGQIADVFLWDRILNPKEITTVYNCDFTDEANVINWHLHSWIPINGVQVSEVNLPCGYRY